MTIEELQTVSDLQDGSRAYPSRRVEHHIQSEDDPSLDTIVEFVERRGDVLLARGRNGIDYAVSGTGSYELKTVRKWLKS
jgi:hypothetical protein